MTENEKGKTQPAVDDKDIVEPTAAAMSEPEPDESAVALSEAETDTETQVKPEPVKKTRRNAWFILLGLLLVILSCIAAGGYWAWGVYQADMTSIRAIQQETQAQIAANQAAFERIEQLSLGANEQWQTAFAELEQVVVSSAQRLNREANRNESRWPLEEALTLTRLAQQRLQLDASAVVAVGLLRSADEVLAGLDQAAVLPLRRQLAADILALQMTSAADIQGLYFQLEAISSQLNNLNWQPKPASAEPLPSDLNPAAGFWHSLKQIVVVTKMDVPRQATPLLSDFEQWRQRQLLIIEQIQLALLARNQLLFDAALEQSMTGLGFMVSQFELTPIIENLTSMSRAILNPQWPELSASVEVIELYLAEQTAENNAEVTP